MIKTQKIIIAINALNLSGNLLKLIHISKISYHPGPITFSFVRILPLKSPMKRTKFPTVVVI